MPPELPLAPGMTMAGMPPGPMGAMPMPDITPIEEKPKSTREDVELAEQEEDEDNEKDYTIELDLTDAEKKVLASRICAEINDILNDPDRQELMTKIEEWEREYDGVVSDKSSLFEGASNFHTYMGARHVDRARPRIKQAIFIKPFWIIDPQEKADVEVIDKLESLLDYKAQVEMKLPGIYNDLINDACKRGTGILKLTYFRKKEWMQDLETFDNPDEFIRVYGEEAKEKYPKFYKRLMDSEKITFVSRYKDYSYKGPKAERVSRKDFVFSVGKRDLEECRLVGHRFELTWHEIQEKADEGIFANIDNLKIMKDKDKDGNDVDNPDYEEETYECYEVIYKFYNKKGELTKGVFTVELDRQEMLQANVFPYFHNKCYFIPFYILRDEDSFDGHSLIKMVRQISRAQKRVLDVLLDSGIVMNIPTFFKRQASGFSPDQGKFFPGKIWTTADPNNDVKQLIINGAPSTLFNLIPMLEQFGEQRTGISSGASGQQTPGDPNAPGNKTIALLQESNINISEFVENFQVANAEVGYQIGQLIYQFMDEEEEQRILGKGEKVIPVNITREEARFFRADFRPHGSTAISNKIIQHQINTVVRQVMLSSPLVQALVQQGRFDIVRELDEAFLSSAGGEWDKKIDKILPSADELKRLLPPPGMIPAGGGGGMPPGRTVNPPVVRKAPPFGAPVDRGMNR